MPREKDKKLLAVDVGNTAIHIGYFKGCRLARVHVLKTKARVTTLSRQIKTLCRKYKAKGVASVVMCSVVPKRTRILEKIFFRELEKKICLAGRDRRIPLINRTRHPRQVGADRMVGAYAAVCLYRCPVIVVDLGTAITLDAVSGKKEYLGGIIVPGINLSAEVLHERTALLPLVKINKPDRIIGRDTQSAILSGLFYGYGAMLHGLVGLLKKQLSSRTRVVMTGGYAGLMKDFFQKQAILEPELVLKGLCFLENEGGCEQAGNI